jgi:Na+:H+ antiporter, NhaA family
MKASKLFKEFFESEKAGGIVLVICTVFSMILANTGFRDIYVGFWNTHIADHELSHWVNDGLMTIFFLLIGLELEREIYKGELSNLKNALLPMSGAVGGMFLPAIIFLFFNWGTHTQDGAGIPMATDIAFALGILSLLGNKVPVSLKIFLTALAVIDDLGAIIVIAIFYTKSIVWMYLLLSLGIWVVLLILNRLKVHHLLPYIIGGIAMWYCMLHSGVHATVTGVLLAFAIPFGDSGEKSPSYVMQHWLHKPVAFIILPLFALANTAVIINSGWQHSLTSPLGVGILAGLVLGKPIGIMLVSFIAVKTRICRLPPYIKWKHILGTGLLAGIGFTMSIFITLLAFQNEVLINNAKFLILIASLISGLVGFLWLSATLKNKNAK